MKTVLVNPPHWQLTGINNNQNPGLGLLYIASQLDPKDTIIIDAEALRLTWEQLKIELTKLDPDVIGVGSTTLSFKALVRTCKLARKLKPTVRLIIGGPHVSALPHKSLALSGADAAVVGEGEIAFKKALDKDGVIIGEPFTDLDVRLPRSIHVPDITSDFYIGNDPIYVRPETVVVWERGCPHRCNFCSTHKVHGRLMRRRTVESIIEELKELKRQGIRSVFIYDDELVGVNEDQKSWLIEICESIISEDLDLQFKSQGRCSQLIDDDLLEMMKAAGFKALMMGCESGSQKVLDIINKNLTITDIKHSIPLIQKYMDCFTYWMIGNKGETSQDAYTTYKLIQELKPKFKHVTILNPLPGSDIYKEAMREGWILNHNFNFWSQHGFVVMQGDWMTAREILDWEKKLIET